MSGRQLALEGGEVAVPRLPPIQRSLEGAARERHSRDVAVDTVRLLIDPENGTVGYDVSWGGSGGGRSRFTREGVGVSGDSGPDLEQHDLIPELVLSLGTDVVRGAVMRGCGPSPAASSTAVRRGPSPPWCGR